MSNALKEIAQSHSTKEQHTMKTAIPVNDGVNISAHFGRSKGFIIFETGDKKIIKEEYRENSVTGHATGQHHEHGHDHGSGEHPVHSHTGILELLADCETIIAGGMGRRLFTDMQAAGKKVYITREENARKAMILLLGNDLDSNTDMLCQH